MRLRGHHLLCLLGFRGLGYSPGFLEDMTRIVLQLLSNPQTAIEVVDGPDDICAPCPFLVDGGCSERGPHSEAEIRNRDLEVIARLGLEVGERGEKVTWAVVEERIRSSITPDDLVEICADCQWLPLGYCVEGLGRLVGPR